MNPVRTSFTSFHWLLYSHMSVRLNFHVLGSNGYFNLLAQVMLWYWCFDTEIEHTRFCNNLYYKKNSIGEHYNWYKQTTLHGWERAKTILRFIVRFCPAINFCTTTRVLVRWSKDCHIVALFSSNNMRLPMLVKFRLGTDLLLMFVNQAMVPSVSCNTKPLSKVSFKVALTPTGFFGWQTILELDQ